LLSYYQKSVIKRKEICVEKEIIKTIIEDLLYLAKDGENSDNVLTEKA
jgi:hypothetical protein